MKKKNIYIFIITLLSSVSIINAQQWQRSVGIENKGVEHKVDLKNVSKSEITIFNPFSHIESAADRGIDSDTNSASIDLRSFRFKQLYEDSNVFIVPSDPYEYSTKQGTYRYDPTIGKIAFAPNKDIAVESEDIYFDVQDRPSKLKSNDSSVEESLHQTSKITMRFSLSTRDYIIVNANPIQH